MQTSWISQPGTANAWRTLFWELPVPSLQRLCFDELERSGWKRPHGWDVELRHAWFDRVYWFQRRYAEGVESGRGTLLLPPEKKKHKTTDNSSNNEDDNNRNCSLGSGT